jgi:hypothetical protein
MEKKIQNVKLWQVVLLTAIFGGMSGGGWEFLANPNADSFGTLLLYTAGGAVIGAVVWFLFVRRKAKPTA